MACPIYNGTLKSFGWSIMREISIMPSFKNHNFNLCFLNDFFASKTIDWLMKWSTLQARKTKISFVTLIRFRFKGYSLKFGIYAPITTKQSQIQQFTFEENQLINIYNFQIERQVYLLLRNRAHRGSRMINWNDADSLFNLVFIERKVNWV